MASVWKHFKINWDKKDWYCDAKICEYPSDNCINGGNISRLDVFGFSTEYKLFVFDDGKWQEGKEAPQGFVDELEKLWPKSHYQFFDSPMSRVI